LQDNGKLLCASDVCVSLTVIYSLWSSSNVRPVCLQAVSFYSSSRGRKDMADVSEVPRDVYSSYNLLLLQ